MLSNSKNKPSIGAFAGFPKLYSILLSSLPWPFWGSSWMKWSHGSMRDCHFIAAHFSIMNRLCSKRLLFSVISNSTAFTFSCSSSSFKLEVRLVSLPHSHDVTGKCGANQKQGAQFINVLAPVQDKVVGIVAAWLRHSVTSQTPENEKSNLDY